MMMPMLFCSVILSLVTIFVFYIFSTLTNNSTSSGRDQLPPGKTGWPVIGESLEFLLNMKYCRLQCFSFKRMAKYSPDIFKTSVLGDHVAVFCGAEGNKFLFSKANKLVKSTTVRPARKLFPSDQLSLAFKQYMRPGLVSFIKADGLKSLVGVMDTVAQQHFGALWSDGQVVKVYPLVKRYAFELACRLFMAVEDSDIVDKLFEPIQKLASGIQSFPINLPGTRFNQALKARDVLRLEIVQIIKQRRLTESSLDFDVTSQSDHKASLLSHFLKVHEDDMIVADGIVVMLVAGHDTIASVLSLVFKFMADYPHIYDKVHQENLEVEQNKKAVGELLCWEDTTKLKYTWNVAREAMRLYPTTSFLTREALTDFTYAGYHLPKGYMILTNIYAIHNDPKYFPDPSKFDPGRFEGSGPLPYTYIPFGGGPSMCPGMNLAQLSILVFIHNAVKRFKWTPKIRDEKVTGIPTAQPAHGLPVLLHLHH